MNQPEKSDCVLVVDLDDSLIKTDLLWEQFLRALKSHPLTALSILSSALGGLAPLKAKLAALEPSVEAPTLPYREPIIDLIRDHRQAGGKTILASASPGPWVNEVARYLGFFDVVISSDAKINRKGEKKLEALTAELQGRPFRYVGDSKSDIPLWLRSEQAIVVNPTRKIIGTLNRQKIPVCTVSDKENKLQAMGRALRPLRWSKNALVFVPLLAARRYGSLRAWNLTFAAFAAFSLAASSVSILNDLFEISADRRHLQKKSNPFASGALPLRLGLGTLPILAVFSLLLASRVNDNLRWIVGIYLVINLGYTFKFKQFALLGLVALAASNTLRILAGGAAASIVVSHWFLAWSVFLACALAFMEQ